MRLPVLCTIDQGLGHGGIARVSLLVWQVMRRLFGEHCRAISLCPPGADAATNWDKARFGARVIAGQLRGEFEWLFYDHAGPAVTQLLVPGRYRRPYGIFLHGVEVWKPLSTAKVRALAGASVRVANSRYTAERVRSVHGDLGPIEICPLALLPECPANGSQAVREAAGLLRQIREKSVLIVGRISSRERYKGHFQLIHCWPEVARQMPGAQLVIVGRGDDLPLLKAKAREAGCAGDILFTGWVNEETLAAIYQRVAVYAMPSNAEGFGLVYLEAMKHRLPCIASTTDASGEVVAEGETGFLVDPPDERMLAGRIVALLADPALRRRMGEAGYQRLLRNFSFEQFENRFAPVLERLGEAANQA